MFGECPRNSSCYNPPLAYIPLLPWSHLAMLVTEILAMIAYVSSKYIKLDDTVQTKGRE